MQVLLIILFLTPIGWIFFSGVFFQFTIKNLETDETIFFLKCYCIFMMLLAIEALIRSMIYVHIIWGYLDGYLVSFLIISILVLCFCILAFANFITHSIYLCFALILIAMIVAFSFAPFDAPFGSSDTFVSFDASWQLIFVWGCVAIALYGLSRYTIQREKLLSKGVMMPEKQRILKNKLRFCAVLVIWIYFLISAADTNVMSYEDFRRLYGTTIIKYNRLHPCAFYEISQTEAVNITGYLRRGELDRKHARVVSVMLKNEMYSLQYDVETWFNLRRGVPLISALPFVKSFEDFKKELAADNRNHNSPNLDSPYDGTGNVFFRRIFN